MTMTTTRPPPPPPGLAIEGPGPLPTWEQVLERAGYPTTVIVLDFETYADDQYPGPNSTTVAYVKDSRFEVLGLATMQSDELVPRFIIGEAVRDYLRGLRVNDVAIVCHNSSFDCTVLAQVYGIYPRYVVDTLGLARAWHARAKNDLLTLTKRWGLPTKGITKEFRGVSFRPRFYNPKGRKGKAPPIPRPTPTPDQIQALADYAKNDVLGEWEIFQIMLPRLSNPTTELKIMQHTLELFTRPTLRCDFALGEGLISDMNAKMDAVIAETGHTRAELSGNLRFEGLMTEALEKAGDVPGRYWKVCKSGQKLAEAKDDPERALLLSHPDPGVKGLMNARVAMKSWPLHIARVQRILDMAKALGGTVPVPLAYYAAHTGRWGGGEKVNLQNLPKQGDPLIVAMRGLLMARLDHKLVIVDAAAIEARVLAWIAGQWDLVAKFANREEIYCGFATAVLGWPVRKPVATDLPPIVKRLKWARNSIGKVGILGCGYGLGPREPGTTDKPNYLFAAAGLDFATAKKIVNTYRQCHTDIIRFWHDLEHAFSYVAKYHQPCGMVRGLSLYPLPYVDVAIRLPTGRELHYHKVRVEPKEWRTRISVYNEMEHKWDHVFGGSLTENVVQAISRDVLIEAGMRLEAAGHHVAFHCHDELVISCPTDQAEAVLKLTVDEMSKTPVWAPGMSLAAEGWIGERYGK